MLKLITLFASIIFVSVAGAQNVLLNGNFEIGPYDTIGVVTDWVVVGNVGEVGNEGFTSPSHAAAFSLGGSSQGDMLSQSFATSIGQVYTLDFDAGVFGARTQSPLQLQVQVFGAGTLLNQTVTPPENGTFNPAPFAHYTYMFTADSGSTTLKFTDVGLGNQNADVILDTVSVVPAPEPATWALMTSGAVSLLYVLRRRRSV
jgi:hypothetical protein